MEWDGGDSYLFRFDQNIEAYGWFQDMFGIISEGTTWAGEDIDPPFEDGIVLHFFSIPAPSIDDTWILHDTPPGVPEPQSGPITPV